MPAENEHHLQEVMKESPKLLPVDDLGITGPLLVVGREASVASGSRRCRHRGRQLPHEELEAGRTKVLRIASGGRETRVGTLDEPDACHPLSLSFNLPGRLPGRL
jgi:hypothetical protein